MSSQNIYQLNLKFLLCIVKHIIKNEIIREVLFSPNFIARFFHNFSFHFICNQRKRKLPFHCRIYMFNEIHEKILFVILFKGTFLNHFINVLILLNVKFAEILELKWIVFMKTIIVHTHFAIEFKNKKVFI